MSSKALPVAVTLVQAVGRDDPLIAEAGAGGPGPGAHSNRRRSIGRQRDPEVGRAPGSDLLGHSRAKRSREDLDIRWDPRRREASPSAEARSRDASGVRLAEDPAACQSCVSAKARFPAGSGGTGCSRGALRGCGEQRSGPLRITWSGLPFVARARKSGVDHGDALALLRQGYEGHPSLSCLERRMVRDAGFEPATSSVSS